MADIPNLAGVATADLVEQIGANNFKASYINWSRTVQMLRDHAPGWMPELVHATDGGVVHRAPVGAFLLIRFRHIDGTVTPEVPQAVMDQRNAAVPFEKVTARDITDTHRRGVCMAAAFTFGLAYELWAKIQLESGYAEQAPVAEDTTTLSEEQIATLRQRLAETESDEAKFIEWLGFDSIQHVLASHYEKATKALEAKAKALKTPRAA